MSLPPLPPSSPSASSDIGPFPPEIQAAITAAVDRDRLKMLEIGFYVAAIVTAFQLVWLLFMAVFFAIGGVAAAFAALNHHGGSSHDAPPIFVFVIFEGILGVIIFFTLVFGCLEIYAGNCLKNRKHLLLIQIVAAIYCLYLPWGTALGVFTFIVLSRPSVKALFTRP